MEKEQQLDYESDKGKIKDFLSGFYTSHPTQPGKLFKYSKQLTALANREQSAIFVELGDYMEYPGGDESFVTKIEQNAKRYALLLSEAIAEMLPEFKTKDSVAVDSLDVYIEHRLTAARRHEDDIIQHADISAQFPPELLRRFEAYWKPRVENVPIQIRALKADQIGRLVTVHGTVIRASEVRPLLNVATYSCDMCSAETFQPISGPTFTPLIDCKSEFCKGNKAGGRLQLQTRGSKFVRFQELKIQEQSSDVPAGHVPRAVTVHCLGENTRKTSAGDHVSISGVFLPMSKNSAFAQISAGLLTDTYLDAHTIIPLAKWDEGEVGGDLTEEELLDIHEAGFYDKLAASIAPEVYGHEDVKKSLLLMLVAGVERNVGGLKIRGSINICLMGDPGVAKSQLLSYVDRLAPRSQLTSGRGSSGVGLTASIMKDPVTGLMTLEAGSLMLADQGVCCIDEFDKMSESDRTALHEVMEQQTISIAKAGILTTLHARTAILAAANPAFGRYNANRSLQDNIALPAALLSRFDLLWLLLDKPDKGEDLRIAKHITFVHQNMKEPPGATNPLEMKLMRRYIVACRAKNPTIPPSLSEKLVSAYVELRNMERNEMKEKRDTTFTSPRSLLAILRLSTALARLRMADEVVDGDVNEAIRLVEKSRDSIRPGQREKTTSEARPNEQINSIVRGMRALRTAVQPFIWVKDIRSKCTAAGFTNEQLDRALEVYEVGNVWILNGNRTKLTFAE